MFDRLASGEVSCSIRPYRGCSLRATDQNGKGWGNSGGECNLRGGLYVQVRVLTQQHGGSLWFRELLRVATVWGLLELPGLSYIWMANAGDSFVGYVMEWLKMAKNPFIWSYGQNNSMHKISVWHHWDLEPMDPTLLWRSKQHRANMQRPLDSFMLQHRDFGWQFHFSFITLNKSFHWFLPSMISDIN